MIYLPQTNLESINIKEQTNGILPPTYYLDVNITTTRAKIGYANLIRIIYLIKHEEKPIIFTLCNEPIKLIFLHCSKFYTSRLYLNRPIPMEEALEAHNFCLIYDFLKLIIISPPK